VSGNLPDDLCHDYRLVFGVIAVSTPLPWTPSGATQHIECIESVLSKFGHVAKFVNDLEVYDRS
jgi:hypothetical protein